MHQSGYFHRDLKPENLLVTKDLIKIADFGLAREVNSSPPYTEYVSTRWYRAPEVLLQSCLYSSKVDMWAMGAIMAELFTLRPLFPGASEADQIYKICSVIGSPTVGSWADGLQLASDIHYQFPQFPGVKLSALIPSASNDAVSLIAGLCSWDPSKRPSALEVLQHPFFKSCYYIPPSLRYRPAVATTPPSARTARVAEQQGAKKYPGSLSNSKIASSFPSLKSHASVDTGVQRKLELASQDVRKIDKVYKSPSATTQQRYRPPPAKTNPIPPPNRSSVRPARETSDVAEKLQNMSIGPRKPPATKLRPAAPMKAGGQWIGETGTYLRPLAGRALSRKVAG